MTPKDMLEWLGVEGAMASADYNDNPDIFGWFGWGIRDRVLTITYERASDRKKFEASWHLLTDEEWQMI